MHCELIIPMSFAIASTTQCLSVPLLCRNTHVRPLLLPLLLPLTVWRLLPNLLPHVLLAPLSCCGLQVNVAHLHTATRGLAYQRGPEYKTEHIADKTLKNTVGDSDCRSRIWGSEWGNRGAVPGPGLYILDYGDFCNRNADHVRPVPEARAVARPRAVGSWKDLETCWTSYKTSFKCVI
jgi:hypothetical protein